MPRSFSPNRARNVGPQRLLTPLSFFPPTHHLRVTTGSPHFLTKLYHPLSRRMRTTSVRRFFSRLQRQPFFKRSTLRFSGFVPRTPSRPRHNELQTLGYSLISEQKLTNLLHWTMNHVKASENLCWPYVVYLFSFQSFSAWQNDLQYEWSFYRSQNGRLKPSYVLLPPVQS